MKIDKTKLIELLVEKTEMSRDEIEAQLEQLIQRIVDAAERGKALEIKEFGLFYFDDEGSLRFDPSKELSTEINFRYAGMKPIELKPPRDTSAPPVNDDEEELDIELDDDPFADLDEEFEEPEPRGSSPATPSPPVSVNISQQLNDEETGESRERDEDPFAGLLGEASSKMKLEPEEEFDKYSELEKAVWPEPKKGKKTVQPVEKKQKSADPITTIIFVILGFVFVAGGYFVYTEYFQSPGLQMPETTDTETESAPDPDPAEPIQEEPPTVMESVEPDPSNVVTQTDPARQIEEESSDPPYGLMGTVTDAGNDGFSIVVHSFRREEQARNAAADLSREGYRVLVSSRTVQGNPTWRVSIGQFPSIAEAQEQARQLSPPYNTQNFIQRIQIN